MFTSRQAPTESAMLSTVLLFLATAGLHIRLVHSLTSTTLSAPLPSDLTAGTRATHNSSSEGQPLVLHMHHHVPCKEEHAGFCANEGQCMYPQDTEKASCICKPQYGGERCEQHMDATKTKVHYETVVGICLGVTFLTAILIASAYWICKRCIKKSPQKYGGPETSV